MRIKDPHNPTESELAEWAYDSEAGEPVPAWELLLSWSMHRGRLRQFIQLAADPMCDNAWFFLDALFQWVETVAKRSDFELRKTQYECWLQEARGVKDSRVKRWRREALLLFQGQQDFDHDEWMAKWSEIISES